MKPMLKSHFLPLITNLKAQGITPRMEWANVGDVAHLTWEHDGENYRHPVYLTTSGNAYNYRKRYDAWLSESDPLNEEVTPMTPTDAVRHMYHTLAGAIEQSKKPGFNAEEAYADIKTNYELVAYQCDDLAIKVWLKNHLCFGYMGDVCTFEDVNKPYHDQFEHILSTGWLPHAESGAEIQTSTVFEMEWWGADDIVVTRKEGDKTYGHATITDTEGLYQIAFDWVADQGELARSVDLPVLISITAARFNLPYSASLTDSDVLECVQEMDSVFGLSADVFNAEFSGECA